MLLLPLLVVAAGVIAVAIPYVFTQVRDATKERRKGIIKDLDRGFHLKKSHDAGVAATDMIASFEFVKYKYFFGGDDNLNRGMKKQNSNVLDYVSKDFMPFEWIVGAIPLVMTLFVINIFVLTLISHICFGINFQGETGWLNDKTIVPLFVWVVLASFTGGMLFMLRAFNQAINNFDLSPLSFVGATVNLAFGMALALLMAFAVLRIPDDLNGATTGVPNFPIVILTAFLAGYFPDVALRTVLRLGHLRFYKSEQEDIYKSFKAIPVEIIDGIDSDIRTRLADYHINSVQNLATANPLMLFVETPYGVYEIMDWVAQAQLCASIGPESLLSFWKLGIRTIFDLERIAMDDACHDESLLREIGAILWRNPGRDPTIAEGRKAAGLGSSPFTSTILADLRFPARKPACSAAQANLQSGQYDPGAGFEMPAARLAAPMRKAECPLRLSLSTHGWAGPQHRSTTEV